MVHRIQKIGRRRVWTVVALAEAFAVMAGTSLASDFEIVDISFTPEGAPRIAFSSNTDSYYALYRINLQSGVWVPVAMKIGGDEVDSLIHVDLNSLSQIACYAVRQVSLDSPLDTDLDGIDDVFELLNPTVLNPLNSGDAILDHDGDGRTLLVEYRELYGLDKFLQAISRETSVFNFGARTSPFEAMSREVSVYNGFAFPATDISQIISREVSVFNFGAPSSPVENISREVSLFNFESPSSPIEAISKELSVYNGSAVPATDIHLAVSRELTVFNFGAPSARLEAISREVSVLNFDKIN